MSDIILGATYRDAVSGFQGVAMSSTRFLFACERVCLQARNADGALVEQVFDVPQLVFVEHQTADVHKAICRATAPTARTGGDRPMPSAVR